MKNRLLGVLMFLAPFAGLMIAGVIWGFWLDVLIFFGIAATLSISVVCMTCGIFEMLGWRK